MKMLLSALVLLTSTQSFANQIDDIIQNTHEYTGTSSEGAPCSMNYDSTRNYVSTIFGATSTDNLQHDSKGNLVIEGSADFSQMRVTIALNQNQEPGAFKVETKSVIKPFYTTKLTCLNLKRTN